MDVQAFLRVALEMTLEQAKEALGFASSDTPSEDEVRRAQRQRIGENHPDRGGDPEKALEVNIAADILLGKQAPLNYDRRPRTEDYGGHAYRQPAGPPPKDTVITFSEAKAKAGVPSGVDWLFVTDRQRATSYSSDEFERSDSSYVACGRKDGTYYFVGMRYFFYKAYALREGKTDTWEMHVVTEHPSDREATAPAWFYGNVVRALKAVSFGGRFNSKVYDGRGWDFNEKFKANGTGKSIKHILVDLGLVGDDDPSVANRKHVVELTYLRSIEEGPHTFKIPGAYDAQGIKLTLNGHDFMMSKSDVEKFLKIRIGGKGALDAIFKGYFYSGSSKLLTRIREAKVLLPWMAENLTDLPEAARKVLAAAAVQVAK